MIKKKYGNKKWSLNFHDKPKNQNTASDDIAYSDNLNCESLISLKSFAHPKNVPTFYSIIKTERWFQLPLQ